MKIVCILDVGCRYPDATDSQLLLPPELIEANSDKVYVEDDITALTQCAEFKGLHIPSAE